MDENLYDALGVGRSATHDEIKGAYRKLAMQWHPDRNGNSKESEEKFKHIAYAYSILGDPAKRKKYDEELSEGAAGGESMSYEEAAALFFAVMLDLARDLVGKGYEAPVIMGALIGQGCPEKVAKVVADAVVGIHRDASGGMGGKNRSDQNQSASHDIRTSKTAKGINRKWFFLFIAVMAVIGLFLFGWNFSNSQDVYSPKLTQGDHWIYSRYYNKNLLSEFSIMVKKVNSENSVFLDKNNLTYTDSKETYLFSVDNWKKEPSEHVEIKFPLYVGKSWITKFESKDASNTSRIYHVVQNRSVVGWEKITVPAGTFDALKIAVTDAPGSEIENGGVYQLWYSPSAKAVIKIEAPFGLVEVMTSMSIKQNR